jgi:2-polyprenyl-6-methoxyphenol hydroxylase-like FAD-dependent oxidoreductase
MSNTIRRATEPLDVLIVGAGVDAFASAYALQNAGHHCSVLDPNPEGYVEHTRGTLVSPNASRVLHTWGIAEDVLRDAIPLQGFTFASGSSPSPILLVFLPLTQDF